MAVYLAVETSSRKPSLAWQVDGKIYPVPNDVSDKTSDLVSILQRFLNENSFTLNDLSVICVSKGPGNYTGLRMGMAFVQALAFTRELSIETFNSVDVTAASHLIEAPQSTEFTVAIDARGGQITTKSYQVIDHVLKATTELVCDDPEKILPTLSGGTLIVGSAAERYTELFNEHGFHDVRDCSPTAEAVLSLREQGLFESCELDALAPFYVRSPV